ncbi:exonuclease sbcCD subunit D [Aliidiomarina sedimenti]|uniref:Nuclease SbcCD subunit D n=1 Tax=Aliidiomarina sedimenti TaxID=1933879 RepID=A0ABY0BZR5_9GAMM|nr:exonuclease SbcCD subunit D C-terminal domain-containing protein [Aliidiomarina sedimenti]RUO30037.1 exonuclease sbcCD subunit D [Aliidiomarina sedimenti]
MRVLHTSDWHLGRVLYGQKRHHEFAAFLDWLLQTIKEQRVEALLVAGDIFDTNTPGNYAQQLYYRFLARVAATQCRHVVVIGGNHDSPSFLDAPQQLLSALNVHVIGEACEDPTNEVLCLQHDGELELIVCAVPYLRERDLRSAEDGEGIADKERKVQQGVKAHYAQTAEAAVAKRGKREVPIIGMGHLFTVGGELREGDGVRDLYVGSLGQVPASAFPDAFDYLALGHLHVPQLVAKDPTRRYSGSPIAMGFGEVGQQKEVVLIDFEGREAQVSTLPIPVFQRMERIKGDLEQLQPALQQLIEAEEAIWVEVEYSGTDYIRDLRQRLTEWVADTQVQVLRVRNPALREKTLKRTMSEESLQQLTTDDVFKRRLEASEIEGDEGQRLTELHAQLLQELAEEDPNADH